MFQHTDFLQVDFHQIYLLVGQEKPNNQQKAWSFIIYYFPHKPLVQKKKTDKIPKKMKGQSPIKHKSHKWPT